MSKSIFFMLGLMLVAMSWANNVIEFQDQFYFVDTLGTPLSTVMVTQKLRVPATLDVSDDGYAKPNVTNRVSPEYTRFSDTHGQLAFPLPHNHQAVEYRFKKLGYEEISHWTSERINNSQKKKVVLKKLTDPQKIAMQKSANIWLSALNFPSEGDRRFFRMQCCFCHQQGSEFTRVERSAADWHDTMKRMIRYGSRLPSDLQESLPEYLSKGFHELHEHPELLVDGTSWDLYLKNILITEWPIGDAYSQMHDMVLAKNGKVYVGDNIQDRLYEVDPRTHEVTVFKIPHLPNDQPGGLLQARLRDFPKHDSVSNLHSLAISQVDQHIFITPSAQQRLVEFDPESKKFTLHFMSEGFYPHTIRIDQQDRVWFTLALSNQVAMFDRRTKKFSYFDLPARNFKEKIITYFIKEIYQLMNWGLPLSSWLKVDRNAIGTPLIYGIDIAPDGSVWAARLHTDEIFHIDPVTGKMTSIPTPFVGPRRLRCDDDGNVWISSFGDSLIAKYDAKNSKFYTYPLPVKPAGSETPYALNVDKTRKIVWVTGNQTDAVYAFNMTTENWQSFPMPRKTTFTREIEISPQDGSIFTSNSNFPSWHIEDAQPTLIKLEHL